MEESNERVEDLDTERDSFDKKVALEQYKILFNVIVNLSDNVVKSVLTIFLIYSAIVAVVVRGIATAPQIKNVLWINYLLISAFSYYLGYLRFRIVKMFELAEGIEKGENFKYSGISNYESKTNYKFFSTKGLYLIIIFTLILINNILIQIL